MAISQHGASRRELFGIMATASVALSVGVPAAGHRTSPSATWAAAMKHFEAAKAAEDAYDRAFWRPAFNASTAGGPLVPESFTAEIDRLAEIRCDAENALIAAPAADLSGVIWKIEHARKRWEDFEDWPDAWWAAVMNDLRRMAAMGAH